MSQARSAQRMLILLTVLLLLVVGTTFACFFVFLPATFLSSTFLILAVLIELTGFLMTASFLRPRTGRPQVSGAARLVAFGALPLFAVLALGSTALYGVLRQADGAWDGRFIVLLVAEAVLCLVPAALAMGHDLFGQEAQAEQEELREAHAALAGLLQQASGHLKGLQPAALDLMQRRDAVERRLNPLVIRLRHLNVREGQTLDAGLRSLVEQTYAQALALDGGATLGQGLDALEGTLQRLQAALDAMA